VKRSYIKTKRSHAPLRDVTR